MLRSARKWLPCVLWLVSLSVAPSVFAGEQAEPVDPSLTELKSLSIEELLDIPLVYGASRHSQKITEAPSSISIVTADEIRKFGYRNLSDILRAVQGFYVNNDRAYGYIGVRGFNRPGDFGGRVLVLVDGHRINDPLYDSAPIVDDFILDVDLIERVEIVRGPSFSLYGANAFFGGINVITRAGRDMNGVEFAGRAGSYDAYQGRLSYGKRFDNGLEVLVSGSRFDVAGHEKLYFKEFDSPETNNGIANNLDSSVGERLFGSVAYKDFKLKAGFISREKSVPTAPYSDFTVFNAPGTKNLDERYYLDLTYAHEFDNGLELKSKVYYDSYAFTGNYDTGLSDTGVATSIRAPSSADWFGIESQISKRIFDKHRAMFGVEFKDVFRSKQASYIVPSGQSLSDVSTDWNSISWYLQDEYAVASNVIVNAGLRYDRYSIFGDTINPRLAVIYNPWKKTTLKVLYGEAFRAPNDFERSQANADLRPETIRTLEVIWDQYIDNKLRFSISGYRNDVNDLITAVKEDNVYVSRNLDNARTWGVDFEAELKSESGWRSQFSYSWQNTEDKATGLTLSNSPEHLLKLNVIAPLYADKVFAGFQVQYTDGVQTFLNKHANGYWLTNLNIFSQKILPGMDVSAGIYNLFDERYGLPGSNPPYRQDLIQQDGRTFQFILRQRF
jgi:outer membrane receptor for ferrienterochelin and colicins